MVKIHQKIDLSIFRIGLYQSPPPCSSYTKPTYEYGTSEMLGEEWDFRNYDDDGDDDEEETFN